MILLAMALAAADYPPFDAERTAVLCEAKRKESTWASIYPSNEACIADQHGDYRLFTAVAGGDPAMQASFALCVKRWTTGAGPDWGMISFCAVDMVNGKRDYALLRRAAPKPVRPAIDNCLKSGDDEAAPDWDERWICAREQAAGYRNFGLLRAAADPDVRKAIDGCVGRWTDEESRLIDWNMVADCANEAGMPPSPTDPEEIVVT